MIIDTFLIAELISNSWAMCEGGDGVGSVNGASLDDCNIHRHHASPSKVLLSTCNLPHHRHYNDSSLKLHGEMQR